MARILTLVLVLCALNISFCQPVASGLRSTLNSVDHIRKFKPDASPSPVPVHVRAVVTYYDSVGPNLFVQDATGDVWVDLRGLKDPPPRPDNCWISRASLGSDFPRTWRTPSGRFSVLLPSRNQCCSAMSRQPLGFLTADGPKWKESFVPSFRRRRAMSSSLTLPLRRARSKCEYRITMIDFQCNL